VRNGLQDDEGTVSQIIQRRSRARARFITVAALSAAVVVIAGGGIAIALMGGPRNGILVVYGAAVITIVTLIAVFGALTARLTRAMNTLARRHPDAVVFLARRLPPVVSDMPAYLSAKGIEAHIGDGWLVAFADDWGIAVCSSGANPRELVVIEWTEIGAIEMVRTAAIGGDSHWSVTVDVRPYDVPLTVVLGVAWGIVTMALDQADTEAVMTAVADRRPAN
jgi:hypothetical protein